MRRTFKLPPQVLRILLLAAGIVSSYGMARYFLTPPSFGEHGFYRGAALEEATQRPATFAGRAACGECHTEEAEKLSKSSHQKLSCEGCHGAGKAHTENLDVPMQKLHYSHCVRCHEYNPSRPKTHKQVNTKDHYNGSTCTECHVPHVPTEFL
jgi:hypothetical protein